MEPVPRTWRSCCGVQRKATIPRQPSLLEIMKKRNMCFLFFSKESHSFSSSSFKRSGMWQLPLFSRLNKTCPPPEARKSFKPIFWVAEGLTPAFGRISHLELPRLSMTLQKWGDCSKERGHDPLFLGVTETLGTCSARSLRLGSPLPPSIGAPGMGSESLTWREFGLHFSDSQDRLQQTQGYEPFSG